MSTVPTPLLPRPDEQFLRDGFFLAPPVIPKELLARVVPRMDALVRGEYETGVAPHSVAFKPDDPPEKIRKIDQPHVSDRTVWELVAHPALGALAARVMNAKMIQVWAVQQLVKPPGGKAIGNVGWHQDWQYWRTWWEPESEVFTAWVAVNDVKPDSGPMKFVRGSHEWGFLDVGDFWGTDLDGQKGAIGVPPGEKWEEVPAVLAAGAVSFHHRHTFHASGPNRSEAPRRSYAIHMRTEKSAPLDGSKEYYPSMLGDPSVSPIIHDER